MDRIHIRDLRVRCVIGVTAGERRQKHELGINVILDADLAPGARTDRVEDTINYKLINRRILEVVQASECRLIETLAERVAAACLEFDAVVRVTVTVDKPGALRGARSVGVEIVRTRPT
ncbi:MAG: dihydroneopterin aldolase [Kiritimatiellae bacterium]|nr:dihydroneopterin aldolase [Kiritimatiellia bacterium]